MFYTSRWSCLTRTMSCYGPSVAILSGVAVFYFPGPWLCTPLYCLSVDQLPSSPWTRCWASLHFSGWPFLSRARLSLFLQATLQAASIPGKFSGHSLRIGAATTAGQRGVPDRLIKTMGHWSSEAYLLYVCTPAVTILLVAGRISKQV